jgi:acyl dehydratase
VSGTRLEADWLRAFAARAGETLGTTDWFTINGAEASAFRLAAGAPIDFGDPRGVARPLHPFHLLALMTRFAMEIGLPVETSDWFVTLNYGLDEATWGRPVMPGERLRTTLVLKDVTEKAPGRHLVRRTNIVEAEGEAAPVLTAVTCSYWIERDS